MNKVVIIGRLTADPDIRYAGEKAVARFTVAVDRTGSKEKTADFISCVAWEKKAELLEQYFHKGSMIAVIGRIQTGSYTNKNGQKVYTTDVVVEEITFVESKGKSEPETQFPIPDNDEDLPFN